MARAHLYRPVQDEMGNVLSDIVVRIFNTTDGQLISPVYLEPLTTEAVAQPISFPDGVIDFYLDDPARVRIGVKKGAAAEVFYEDIDVLAPANADGVVALNVAFQPTGTVQADNVQAAIQELATEKADAEHTHAAAAVQRETVTFSTGPLFEGETAEGLVQIGTAYRLYDIETSQPCRVRLYTSDLRRQQDATRDIGTAPMPNSGLILEFISAPGVLAADLTPLVDGVVLSGSVTDDNVPYSITNTGTSNDITVTFTYIRTE